MSDGSPITELADQIESLASELDKLSNAVRQCGSVEVAEMTADECFAALAREHERHIRDRQRAAHALERLHPELALTFSDEELLAALETAAREWDVRLGSEEGRALSLFVASILRPMPSPGEVGRVAQALGRLSREGKVEAIRGDAHATVWWRLPKP